MKTQIKKRKEISAFYHYHYQGTSLKNFPSVTSIKMPTDEAEGI